MCRSQHASEMKLTLFLGAGASMPLGFPDTKKFKTDLEASLAQNQDRSNMLSILQRSGHNDIENVLTAMEELVKLQDNQGYSLLNNTAYLIYKDVQDSPSPGNKSFGEIIADFREHVAKIQNQVYKTYSWNDTVVPRANLKLYDSLFDLLRDSKDGIHICTTNYDQVMENYIDGNGNGLNRVDGFDNNNNERKLFFQSDSFSDPNQNNSSTGDQNCYLYKLHGSLNWVPYDARIRQRDSEEQVADGANFVIYPTLSPKDADYEREPFKTMWKKFQERIATSDVFIVIGYSFRDESINKEFQKFLRRTSDTKMFVISPHASEDTSMGLGSETFIHNNLPVSDSATKERIFQCMEEYRTWRDSADYPDVSKLMDALRPSLPLICGKDNPQINNWIGTLEDVSELGLASMISHICKIQKTVLSQP